MGRARVWITVVALGTATLVLAGCVRFDVTHLSSDALGGRNNNTPGSVAAQNYLLFYLQQWTDGANPDGVGADAYKQPFNQGTNIIGIIPGTDLADEYVLVGAHYDGLGSSCRTVHPDDTICNGATDNATAVGAVLEVARTFVFSPTPPRRSIILAFWDREEDGLLGSRHFIDNPLVPLEDIVTYVNFDILGANLRPSLRNISFAIGAETGGTRLADMTQAAAGGAPLDMRSFSVIFGQGRSDHAPFVAAGVPAVFFSDSTGPCYHTNADDIDIVDFDKLAQQVAIARLLVRDLASTDSPPEFAPGQPLATYQDAVTLYALGSGFVGSDEFPPEVQEEIETQVANLEAIIDAGPNAFDNAAILTTLQAALSLVDVATSGPCDGFLAD